MNIEIFGLTFHLYGLIVGIAVSVGLLLAEYQAKKQHFPMSLFGYEVVGAVVGGLLGARLYHVFTDWELYQENLYLIPQVWNGGLSIIGALLGGGAGLVLALLFLYKKKPVFFSTISFSQTLDVSVDIAALSLPVAQVIGRFGNYVNQELYGWPTKLPWGIFIDVSHRPVQFLSTTHFHPLFAYEAIGMGVLAAFFWWAEYRNYWKVGSTKFALAYLSWYGVFRGCLEFLRIDKTYFGSTSLGFNQVVLFLVGGVSSVLLMRLLLKEKKKFQLEVTHGILAMFLASSFFFSACTPVPTQSLLQVPDRSQKKVTFHRQQGGDVVEMNVEVVNTDASRELGLSGRSAIGSDGMLFIFPLAEKHLFWMKDMSFSLDLLWMHQGKIVDITHDVPFPTAEENKTGQLPTYGPPQPVSIILEIPAGTSRNLNLQPGDSFEVD